MLAALAASELRRADRVLLGQHLELGEVRSQLATERDKFERLARGFAWWYVSANLHARRADTDDCAPVAPVRASGAAQ